MFLNCFRKKEEAVARISPAARSQKPSQWGQLGLCEKDGGQIGCFVVAAPCFQLSSVVASCCALISLSTPADCAALSQQGIGLMTPD